MAFISVTWQSMHDAKVCPVCRDIDGYTWTFEVGKGELTGQLIHPKHGVVWTIDQGSQAHGHKGNCRCMLTHELNIQDLIEKTNQILTMIREMVPKT